MIQNSDCYLILIDFFKSYVNVLVPIAGLWLFADWGLRNVLSVVRGGDYIV